MVETQLVTDDITLGQKALEALDAESVVVRSAFWFYVPESSEWRLVLALPAVDSDGQEHGYRLVQRTLKKHHVPLMLGRVSVRGVRDPLVDTLRRILRTPPAPNTSSVNIANTAVNGFIVDGAHVHRST